MILCVYCMLYGHTTQITLVTYLILSYLMLRTRIDLELHITVILKEGSSCALPPLKTNKAISIAYNFSTIRAVRSVQCGQYSAVSTVQLIQCKCVPVCLVRCRT